jgi:hypothetical protein
VPSGPDRRERLPCGGRAFRLAGGTGDERRRRGVVHRHDHRGGAAHGAELADHGGGFAQPTASAGTASAATSAGTASAAEFGRHGQREQSRACQRVDLLSGEYA